MTDRVSRVVAMLFALLLAVVTLGLNRDFFVDDAYITLRYARNYLEGFGLVWNPGEYVQGYTSFLHVAIIALLGRLGVDLVLASRIVGVTALVLLLVVAALYRLTATSEPGDPVWDIPVILVATSSPMLVWSLGGLEGTLFALLVAGGCLLFLLAGDAPRKHWLYLSSGIVFGLSILARPDGVVFVGVSLAWLLFLTLKSNSQAFHHVIAFLGGVAMIVTPYAAWQIGYYGDFVPNTYYAKTGAPLSLSLDIGARYLLRYLGSPPFLPILLVGSVVYALSTRRRNPKLTYLTLSVSAYGAYVVYVGGDHMPSFRLLLPLIPLMGVMLTMILVLVMGPDHRVKARVATFAILLVASLQLLSGELNPRGQDPAAYFGTAVGKYVARAWPAGSLIALNGASTPYYAGTHRFVDMLGLNDATISRRKIEKLELSLQRLPGHLKGDGRYVLSRRPDYIIVGPAQGTDAHHPWFLSDLEVSLDPRFEHEYAEYRVLLDDAAHGLDASGFVFTYYKRETGQEDAGAGLTRSQER